MQSIEPQFIEPRAIEPASIESGNTSASVTLSLSREWTTLQNNYEGYERSGLLIKLVAVVLWVALLCLGSSAIFGGAISIAFLIVLWIQEGIYRTFQARIGARILRIEQLLRENPAQNSAYQFHSEWVAARPRGITLLREYVLSMFRPTVAFPYAVLILIDVAATFVESLRVGQF